MSLIYKLERPLNYNYIFGNLIHKKNNLYQNMKLYDDKKGEIMI